MQQADNVKIQYCTLNRQRLREIARAAVASWEKAEVVCCVPLGCLWQFVSRPSDFLFAILREPPCSHSTLRGRAGITRTPERELACLCVVNYLPLVTENGHSRQSLSIAQQHINYSSACRYSVSRYMRPTAGDEGCGGTRGPDYSAMELARYAAGAHSFCARCFIEAEVID